MNIHNYYLLVNNNNIVGKTKCRKKCHVTYALYKTLNCGCFNVLYNAHVMLYFFLFLVLPTILLF